jgi:hypothetical protein
VSSLLQVPSLKVDRNCALDAVPEDLDRLIDRVERAVDEMPPGTREVAQQARNAAADERLFAAARQRATDIANGNSSVLRGGIVGDLEITVDGNRIGPLDPKPEGFDRDLRGADFTCEKEVCTATTASATYTLHFGFDDDGATDVALEELVVVHKP